MTVYIGADLNDDRAGRSELDRRRTTARRLNSAAGEAVEQDGEDDEGRRDVEPVAFAGEFDYRQGHAGNGRGDQQQEPKLDQTARMPSECITQNVGSVANVGWLATKQSVLRQLMAVLDQVKHTPDEHHDRRDKESCTQKLPEKSFELLVAPSIVFSHSLDLKFDVGQCSDVGRAESTSFLFVYTGPALRAGLSWSAPTAR
jgi:hypothetical protein